MNRESYRQRTALDWTVGHAAEAQAEPETFVPATVPGAVQLDWAKAQGWPDYWLGQEPRRYGWMEDEYWTYRAPLDPPAVGEGQRLVLVIGGVDYEFDVLLNGEALCSQEGMFRPVELDLTGRARQGDELRIRVHPAPKREGAKLGRWQADSCCKPAVSYGWDWHPRLVPLGIWQEAYWEVRPDPHLADLEVRYELSDDLDRAELEIHWALNRRERAVLAWELHDPDGQGVLSGEQTLDGRSGSIAASLHAPRLWWPNEQGPQDLYTLHARLLDAKGQALDAASHRVGFRRVRLVMNEGAWKRSAQMPPVTRAFAPMTLEINGRAIFAKGTNWVNPEIFPGTISDKTYQPLLQLAREAHFNLLRCWGGAIVNKESFFDLCDEMGLMVWQEFPLSCNSYPDDAHYLGILDAESRSIIRRGRRHASVAIWCGGNELFNAWSGMTDQSLPLRLLNRNCYDLDPRTPFLATSPLYGVGHGDYRFRRGDDGKEVYEIFGQSRWIAYTEFGCPGPSPADYIRTFIPAEELWPPREGTSWEAHHAFKAWAPADSWLFLSTLEHYFGPSDDLETLCARGQWLQCEGYRFIYEEARRQKMHCSMALNWCYNEPWPTAANNSLVNWPAKARPAYEAVKDACRLVLASAAVTKFSWRPGESFATQLWMLNDAPTAQPGGTVRAVLELAGQRREVGQWRFDALPANTNAAGPEVRFELPADAADEAFTLHLEVSGRPECNSAYRLRMRA